MKKYEAPQMLVVDYEPIDLIAASESSSESSAPHEDNQGGAKNDWGEYLNKEPSRG